MNKCKRKKEKRTSQDEDTCGVSNTLLTVNALRLFRFNTFLNYNVFDKLLSTFGNSMSF